MKKIVCYKQGMFVFITILVLFSVHITLAGDNVEDEPHGLMPGVDDVFYPPESLLSRHGFSIDNYKLSLVANAPKNRYSSVNNIWGTCPLSGTIRIPVLLVQFTDKMPTQTQATINQAFNSTSYLNGSGISVSRYYDKQSYGQLNVIFDVYDWVTMPRTYAYYSSSNTNIFSLIIDAYTTLGASIDFTQYDNNQDGRIDGAVIVYPDRARNIPNGIWPQTRILKQYNSNAVDGKYLGNAALVPSLGNYGSGFEIAVTVHEFAHVLGLPDLYPNSPSGQIGNGPMNQMTMMIFNTSSTTARNKPINLDAWSRYFLGWINPIEVNTDSPKVFDLRCVNYYPDVVKMRNNTMGTREFFLVENRQRNLSDSANLDNAMFSSASTSDGGLAIYHVDEAKIEADYPNNWIIWDRDGNYWDDTVSWPGIYFEENCVTQTTTPDIYTQDMYYLKTDALGRDYGFFDEIARVYSFVDDNTSSTYTGVANPKIRLSALSVPNSFTMSTKILVGEETIAPVGSPVSGTYFAPVYVHLSASPDAVIYYTCDGSQPTAQSQVYLEPIELNLGTTQIRAVAKIPGYYISDEFSAFYTVLGALEPPIVFISELDGNIELIWEGVENAAYYEVYCSDSPNGTWSFLGSTDRYNYTDASSTKKFYRVVAISR